MFCDFQFYFPHAYLDKMRNVPNSNKCHIFLCIREYIKICRQIYENICCASVTFYHKNLNFAVNVS